MHLSLTQSVYYHRSFAWGVLFQLSQLHLPKDLLQIANIFLGNLHLLQMSGKLFSVSILYYLSHVMIVSYNGLCAGNLLQFGVQNYHMSSSI